MFGLVLGKFYPPHSGHHYLINEAKKQVRDLIVLCLWSETESIHGRTRKRILEEMHPDCMIHESQCEIVPDYDSDDVWTAHIDHINEALPDFKNNMRKLAYVFTSEDYGDELARRLNAKHVCVDKNRLHMPISGTAIRENPAANWQHLAEPTRALLTKRIVITGAESTGSTTLTKTLAEHYDTVWVPEYGRFYTEGTGLLNHEWKDNEFVHIAEEQNRIEDFMARKAGPVMFCDTDALSTGVWAQRYMWERSPKTEELIRDYEHYFVTDWKEIPFEDDGLRDGNDGIREWMQRKIINELDARYNSRGFDLIHGNFEERAAMAVYIVNHLIKEGWHLAPPLDGGSSTWVST